MDVKLIPGDPQRRAFTAGMFDGFVYLVNTTDGTHLRLRLRGHRAPFRSAGSRRHDAAASHAADGDRLIFGFFQAGQVGMLDVSDPEAPFQTGIVNMGLDAGPHAIALTDDDKRLVVTDYFLNEDDFGKIHFEGDHKVRVIRVHKDHLELDPRFNLDFNTAFATGPARPHGVAMK